jgi:rod shape-determining protein MreC
VRRPVSPVAAFVDRIAFGALVVACLVLLILAKTGSGGLEAGFGRVRDAFTPALDTVAAPVRLARDGVDWVRALLDAHAENERLRASNATLASWRLRAVQLETENGVLRAALRMPPATWHSIEVSARVVADGGGPFVDTVLIDAGAAAGVAKGMAAVDGQGLLGRVVTVGRDSARVLLLTDFNSKLPVRLEPSGDRAILAGDNTPEPRLTFLPLEPSFEVGDRVVTASSGGGLPAGLPIGRIVRTGPQGTRVEPFVQRARLDVVRLLGEPPLPTPEQAPAVPTDTEPALASRGGGT